MSARFFSPRPQFFDSTPNVLSGARLFFYSAGTSEKLDTYSDEDLSVANTNPIVLNSSGYPGTSIFMLDQAYKVILAPAGSDDPPSSPIWTEDNYYATDFQSVAETKVGSGSPTGNVAGTAGSAGVVPSFYFDYTNGIYYFAAVTGDAATTVWTALNASAATPSVPHPQGYLTLVSATPVIVSDQVSATTVYYTPDKGNLVPLYNGASFTPIEFSELELDLVSAHAASTLYDIFVWSESGVVTMGTGPAWSTSTAGAGARGTGASTTELSRINGLQVNAVQITARNGNTTYTVGANRGTYVGSIFIDGTQGQVTCHRAFGQSRKWGLWNAYNRRPVFLRSGDATASWTYNTASFRASNSASANSLTIFSGLAEEMFTCSFEQNLTTTGNMAANARIGIGVDSTTVATGKTGIAGIEEGGGDTDLFSESASAKTIIPPQIGISVITALELGETSGSITFLGGSDDMLLLAHWMG